MEHRDIPIKTKNEDKLNFSEFASKISKGILNYQQNDTLIFAIEGEWGSGKTSLMNLIKNDLKNNVEILHFNPWLLTDITQVIKLFFDELIKVLSYGSFNVKFNEDIKKDLIKFASLILPESLTIDVKFIKLDYKPKDLLPSIKDENIEKLKFKINEYLRNLDKKIVVVVDDIDRLTDNETEFIFRLTKGIADFDNLIYILLYDKGVVGKSLEKFKSENGEKYLEKIVQYSLSVPKPHMSTIKQLLFEQLDEILSNIEQDNRSYIFQKDRWSYVHRIVGKYIKTVRDISQIINIMSFEYPIICEDVNFTDFFLISLLKIKNHELYDAIKNKPEQFFVDPNNILLESKKQAENIRKNFKDKLTEFHDFTDVLEILFPALKENNYSGHTFYNDHKEKFICDIYYHENYFAFAMSDDKLTIKEYYNIELALLNNDFEKFKILILEADKNKKSPIFLDMFVQLKLKDIDDNNEIENAFMNFIKISQLLESKDNRGFFTATPINWRCESIAFEIVVKHNEFNTFIEDFILNNEEIRLQTKVDLFEYITKELEKNSHEKEQFIQESSLNKIKQKIKEDLEVISLHDLIRNKELSYLILRFDLVEASLECLASEIRKYIFKSNENFFTILNIFQRTSTVSSSNKGTYERYSISKDSLSKLLDLNEINSYIEEIDRSKIKEPELNLLEYWEKGDRWY